MSNRYLASSRANRSARWDFRTEKRRPYSQASRTILLILASATSLQGVTAYAANANAASTPPVRPSGIAASKAMPTRLSTITITATTRKTTAQSTPISITALDAAQIAMRGIPNVNNLILSTPGFAIRDVGGPMAEYEVRGLNSQGGNSSMVGMYFGEIPLATAFGSQYGKGYVNPGLYDLNRVEVLRGPQGTLYGSSSMGGTVRLIPNEPQINVSDASINEVLSGTASGGGFNRTENGMINIPLGDTAALRIVGSFKSESGWIQRRVIQLGAVAVDPGIYPNNIRPSNFYTAPLQEDVFGDNTSRANSVRAELLWKPTDNLKIEPTLWYQYNVLANPPSVDVNGYPTRPQTPAVWAHWQPFDNPEPQSSSLGFGSLKMAYQWPKVSLTSATGYWNHNALTSIDVQEGFANALSLPAYAATEGGYGNTVSDIGPGMLEQDSTRQLSQEVRLYSTAPLFLPRIPGHFGFVVGYFYQDLHSTTAFNASAQQGLQVLGGPYVYIESQPETLVQNAVYGDLSWRLSPHFKVQGGLRHYHYSMSAFSSEYGAFSAEAGIGNSYPYYSSASIGAAGILPSLTFTFNIDANHMVYATASKGVRLGGISGDAGPITAVPANDTNPLLAFAVVNECGIQSKVLLTTTCNPNIFIPAPKTYKSDSLWSYEIGEKSYFFQHRMLANLDAYWERWNHSQLATELAGFGLSVNGPDAAIGGIELQVDTLLPWGFEFSLSGTYAHSKFLENSAIAGIRKGMQIPDSPQASGSATLQWVHSLGDNLSLFGVIEATYTGDRTDLPFGVTATLANVQQILIHMPAYTVGNLRFGVSGDHWTAALFVNNFTNNHSLVDPQPNGGIATTAFTRYVMLRPLTAGVDITYRIR